MERTSASLGSSGVSQGNQNATASTTRYEVFINHRGPDVKRTLASLVYQWLQDKGLQVFLDKAEFQPGQPLSPTIEDASVHIAIFSSRYAESDWCLKELCLMLQTGAPIIPLFYDVGPQDLRWVEKGEYASAFDKHEKKNRYDSQTISNWKSALHGVSYLSGLEFSKGNCQGECIWASGHKETPSTGRIFQKLIYWTGANSLHRWRRTLGPLLCFVFMCRWKASLDGWMEVTMVDKNGEIVVEWQTTVERGGWVYAIVSPKQSNPMECRPTVRVHGTYHLYDPWYPYHEEYEDYDNVLERVWMARGGNVLERVWMARGGEAEILETVNKLFAP